MCVWFKKPHLDNQGLQVSSVEDLQSQVAVVYNCFDSQAADGVLGGRTQHPLVRVALLVVGQQQVVSATAVQFQQAVGYLQK